MQIESRHGRRVDASTHNEDITDEFSHYLRPLVGQLLKTLKLDAVYHRAEGDWLWAEGYAEPVLDLLGGYGSTILGHNPPELHALMRNFLEERRPVHAQLSVRPGATELAKRINAIAAGAFRSPERYICTFTNSGAEAVEAAIKHALLAWRSRRQHRMFETSEDDQASDHERLAGATPKFLALEGSFHGKTSGAVAVTWNQKFRHMFGSPSVKVEFLPREIGPEELDRVLASAQVAGMSEFAGFFLESVQCEGGIRALTREQLRDIQAVCRRYAVPLIVDEIQTGLFRTGEWFDSSRGLETAPEYLLLGKSLGGSLVKIGAMLVQESLYEMDFGLIHTSTFAEDDLSAEIALGALDLLERRAQDIRRRARTLETRLRAELEEIRLEFPGILQDVRGSGFLYGLQFNLSRHPGIAEIIDALYQTGFVSYVLASYLLNRHGIRVGVTLSQSDTLRVEPSAFISFEQVEKFLGAVHEMCRLLAEGRVLKLTRHFWRAELDPAQANRPSRFCKPFPSAEGHTQIAFLTHLIDDRHLFSVDPMFRSISFEDRMRFAEKFAPVAAPVNFAQQILKDDFGRSVHLGFHGYFLTSDFFIRSFRNRDWTALTLTRRLIESAHKSGARIVGLGQFTSIVTGNGLLSKDLNIRCTTGNALTAMTAIAELKKRLECDGRDPRALTIGIFGATGNIGGLIADVLLGDYGRSLVFYHTSYDQSAKLRARLAELRELHPRAKIEPECGLDRLGECDIVVLATNAVGSLIPVERLKEGAWILDLSVPENIDREEMLKRPDVQLLTGGFLRLPGGQAIETRWVPALRGEVYACIAETILIGLTGRWDLASVGKLERAKAEELWRLAMQSGFQIGRAKG